MRKTSAVLVAMLALAGSASAQEAPRLITMTGYGSAQGVPDRAFVTVGVEARAPGMAAAQRQAASVMTAIQNRLKSLGIPEGAMRTTSLNVGRDFEPQTRSARGFIVTNQIEVRVDDVSRVAAVVDGALEAGGTNVYGPRWDIRNREALEQEALGRAFQDAKRRAQTIALAAGLELGPVHAAEESRAGAVRPTVMAGAVAGRGGAQFADTPVSAGEIDIRATISVSFVLRGR